jgi:hypothetical protein
VAQLHQARWVGRHQRQDALQRPVVLQAYVLCDLQLSSREAVQLV